MDFHSLIVVFMRKGNSLVFPNRTVQRNARNTAGVYSVITKIKCVPESRDFKIEFGSRVRCVFGKSLRDCQIPFREKNQDIIVTAQPLFVRNSCRLQKATNPRYERLTRMNRCVVRSEKQTCFPIVAVHYNLKFRLSGYCLQDERELKDIINISSECLWTYRVKVRTGKQMRASSSHCLNTKSPHVLKCKIVVSYTKIVTIYICYFTSRWRHSL